MATRGIVYCVYGTRIHGQSVEHWLDRSIRSVRRHHPDLPVHTIRTDAPSPESKEGLNFFSLREKTKVFAQSPFDLTLFLDIDTVVLDDIGYGFAAAERHGLACCISECPWARRYRGLAARADLIEYNTGVMFFSRAAAPVFEGWARLAATVDAASLVVRGGGIGVMNFNDQASFALAIDEAGFNPHVLPPNWNYRPEWSAGFFGPLKIWHDYGDPPPVLLDINRYYGESEPVIQFHRSR